MTERSEGREELVPTVIAKHLDIFREFHEPFGITISESKEDWLMLLLDEDPEMIDEFKWGDLAGSVTVRDVQAFRNWLTGDAR